MKPTLFLILFCTTSTLKTFDVTLPLFARYFPGETSLDQCPCLNNLNFRFGGTIEQCACKTVPTPLLANTTTQSFAFLWNYHPTDHFFASFEIPFYRIKYNRNSDRDIRCSKHAGPIASTVGITASVETTDLDFLDFSVETGFITPNIPPCATGCGTPLKISFSTGLFDWLTTGGEADTILFYAFNPAIQYNLCWYIKADHIVRGFSFMLGYSYSRQSPAQRECSPSYTAAQDWSMSTFHLSLSYDLAQSNKTYLPCFEFFYNRILSGKNIVWANVAGFSINSTF